MKTKNFSVEKRREYKKPVLYKLNVSQTQSGPAIKNQENRNFRVS